MAPVSCESRYWPPIAAHLVWLAGLAGIRNRAALGAYPRTWGVSYRGPCMAEDRTFKVPGLTVVSTPSRAPMASAPLSGSCCQLLV